MTSPTVTNINNLKFNIMKTYRLNGQNVFLARDYDMPGVKPLDYIGDIGAYRAEDYNGCDTMLTTDEAYSGETSDAVEIVATVCTNPENEQCLVEGWWSLDYAVEDEFEREFLVWTDGYFEWRSERERMEDEILGCSRNGRMGVANYCYLKKEWDELVGEFNLKNGTCFTAPFCDIVEDMRIEVKD